MQLFVPVLLPGIIAVIPLLVSVLLQGLIALIGAGTVAGLYCSYVICLIMDMNIHGHRTRNEEDELICTSIKTDTIGSFII